MVSRNAKIAVAVLALGGATAAIILTRKSYGAGGFTGTMTIHVENANTLVPIPGAKVTYGTLSLTTDASGNVTFTGAPASGDLSATATGFDNYGPTLFAPTGAGPYYIPMNPTGGGVRYDQSFVFIASSEAASSASVTFHNQNVIPINGIAWCVVKNAAGQTVSLGQSAVQAVAPGTSVAMSIPLSPALPSGTYTFDFFAVDDANRAISGTTSVTATV